MSDIPASVWNEADASNTTAAPDGAPEGMAPSGVNNVLRAHQGAVKRWYKWSTPATTAGTSTAYTISYGTAPGALIDGMSHLIQFNQVNGASPTLNINSLGATPLHFYCGGSWAVLPANMLAADQIVQVVYNSSAGAYRCMDLRPVLSQTFSAVSAVDFTGIPANVNNLRLTLECTVSSNGATISLRTYGADGVLDTGGSDYTQNLIASATGVLAAGTAIGSKIDLAGNVGTGSTGLATTLGAANIQASTNTKFNYLSNHQGSTAYTQTSGVGVRNEADRITGIRILPSAGTITGRVLLELLD